jgi:GNAT superfamily N-acetyltransferase
MSDVMVREFEPGDGEAFRELNVEWIERYFKLEQSDREMLWHPQEAILDKGGRILMAVRDRMPVGCCALIAMGDREYELAKMAVAPAERRNGIGRKLMSATIELAERIGARRLFLGTNRVLTSAIALYESMGFEHLPPELAPQGYYERANVYMERLLGSARGPAVDDQPTTVDPLREAVLRTAAPADLDAIRDLIAASVRGLQHEYSERQREQALVSVFTPDTQLIADGTYFVLEGLDGSLAACGGWSWRKTLYGGDHHHASRDADTLDPATDAAKIRAFFVHPAWSRRGLGTRLLHACEQAAWEAGFRRCEMGATLSGVPLYERHGYHRLADIRVDLPGGERLPIVRMEKVLPAVQVA